MKIGVDGGALCAAKEVYLGTSIFSDNLIEAIRRYDKKNSYRIYAFCKINHKSSPNVSYLQIKPKTGFMKVSISYKELINQTDVFLALNQALPLITQAKIISFCHGLAYIYHPKLYPHLHKKLTAQLHQLITRSDVIVVSSIRVKSELLRLFPNIQAGIIILPFGVPFDFRTTADMNRKPFFLFAGSNAPIKRVDFIVRQFQTFIKNQAAKHFELYLVGQHAQYADFKQIKVFPSISRQRLKILFQQATGYVTASSYESFNLPVLEALSQNCPVIATPNSIIPELKQYVHIAKNDPEFVKLLNKAAHEKIGYNNSSKILREFSWETYLTQLKLCYETIGRDSVQKRRR